MQVVRRLCQSNLTEYSAVLLCRTDFVEHGATAAFDMRRHADQCADRYDTRAADAGHHNVVWLIECRTVGFG